MTGREATGDPLIALLDGHIETALGAGSAFYAVLLERMRDDAKAGGPIRAALRGHEHDQVAEWDAFRLLAGVHRIVLAGHAPDLARHYASVGGDGDAEAAWPAVRALIAAGHAEVVDALAHPLQTNAPTRAKALVGALCLVAEETGLPLRLLELGASAGLNLRLDRFRYEQDGVALGPADSLVRFVNFLTGGRPPLAGGFQVAERAGCDLNPVDATTDDGRLTLLACIFPDEQERFDLLDRAIAVARKTPAPLERAELSRWVADRLAAPRRGLATVVYHTIVWPYLPDPVRRGRRRRDLGRRAARHSRGSAGAALVRERGERSVANGAASDGVAGRPRPAARHLQSPSNHRSLALGSSQWRRAQGRLPPTPTAPAPCRCWGRRSGRTWSARPRVSPTAPRSCPATRTSG